jgi:hypothetical protein
LGYGAPMVILTVHLKYATLSMNSSNVLLVQHLEPYHLMGRGDFAKLAGSPLAWLPWTKLGVLFSSISCVFVPPWCSLAQGLLEGTWWNLSAGRVGRQLGGQPSLAVIEGWTIWTKPKQKKNKKARAGQTEQLSTFGVLDSFLRQKNESN